MKLVAIVIAGILASVLIAGWTSDPRPAPPRAVRLPPTVKKLQHQTYRLSDSEHLVLIDIPDKYVPRRCAVYVDDVTKTSHMNCNFDDAGAAFPPNEEE